MLSLACLGIEDIHGYILMKFFEFKQFVGIYLFVGII